MKFKLLKPCYFPLRFTYYHFYDLIFICFYYTTVYRTFTMKFCNTMIKGFSTIILCKIIEILYVIQNKIFLYQLLVFQFFFQYYI